MLITGGARSGKSRFAEKVAAAFERVAYLATAEPGDDEMRRRIEAHRLARDPGWVTLEEPSDVVGRIREAQHSFDAILVDCITLWLSNLLALRMSDREVVENVLELAASLRQPRCALIVVTNEVGAGIVPVSPLGRRFRDLAGEANQHLAESCARVVLMVAGIPVAIKLGSAFHDPFGSP